MQLRLQRLFVLYLVLFVTALGMSMFMDAVAWWSLRNKPVTLIPAERFADGDSTLADIGNLRPGDDQREQLTAIFTLDELPPDIGGELAVYVPDMKGEGYRLFFNGDLIGSAGDFMQGRANIWNSSFLFTVDEKLLARENTLTIEILHQYEYGSTGGPVLLADSHTARWVQALDQMASAGLTLLGGGIVFSGFILILLMCIVNRDKRNRYFLTMALSLFFLMIYCADYLPLVSLPVSYLLYKKIIMSCLFLCIALFGVSIGGFFGNRYAPASGVGTTLLFLAVTALCRDIITFKRAYDLMLLLLPVNIAVWLTVVIPRRNQDDEAKAFFMAFLFAGLYAVYTVTVLLFFSRLSNSTPFVFIVVYMCLVFLLHNIDISRKNVLIAQEAQQRSFFYRQSITDGLTGLYKNTYIIKAIDEMEPPCAVAMMDVDEFKNINDRYGHPVGNLALIHIAEELRSSVREKDIIGRYGGDEFVVALRDCSRQGAIVSMERFRERIRNSPLECEGQTITVTVSIGLIHSDRKMTSRELIAQADKALYKAKQTGRNRLCAVDFHGEDPRERLG